MRAALDWFHRAPLTTRAIIWAALAGFTFSALNTLLRHLTMNMHPFQAQFLRYLMGALVMLPLMLQAGLALSLIHILPCRRTFPCLFRRSSYPHI